jgi:V8-like Glu-specific endopeptidase
VRYVTGALLAAAVLAAAGAVGCEQGGAVATGAVAAGGARIALGGRAAAVRNSAVRNSAVRNAALPPWQAGGAGQGETAGQGDAKDDAAQREAGGDDAPEQELASETAIRARAALPPADVVPAADATAEPDSVGALFVDGVQTCTASVVDSPERDLLVTAAHCVYWHGYARDVSFVPGYADGQRPYGTWVPQSMLVDPRWSGYADPDLDVAFIVLQPLDGRNIQDVVGGNRLALDPGYTMLVRVSGYPVDSGQVVTCVNWTTRQSQYQLRFDCAGLPDGTSGSPWLTGYDPATGTGTVAGLIGGYQQGGDTSSVSYSPYFNWHVRNLYEQAIEDQS